MSLEIATQKKILEDILQEKPEDGYTSAESVFRKDLEKDVEEAKRNNWVLEIPAEWEI